MPHAPYGYNLYVVLSRHTHTSTTSDAEHHRRFYKTVNKSVQRWPLIVHVKSAGGQAQVCVSIVTTHINPFVHVHVHVDVDVVHVCTYSVHP